LIQDRLLIRYHADVKPQNSVLRSTIFRRVWGSIKDFRWNTRGGLGRRP